MKAEEQKIRNNIMSISGKVISIDARFVIGVLLSSVTLTMGKYQIGGNHMDISALSMEMNQPKIQQYHGRVLLKTDMDTGKENDNQIKEKRKNDVIDPNIGQNLDVIADKQMDKKEELHKQQQQEMKWAQEKQKMLNLKEVKLLQMREIAEQGKQVAVTEQQISNLNHRLDKLAAQVSAIDSESKRTKDGKKLE